jgi:two-component system chemotaxis response regulator CheY
MALNVLVVDDSAMMRAVIIKTLRISGLPIGETYQASNGAEGLQILKQHWIDLVMVDLNMPVMGGEQMVDRMRAVPHLARLPVIVVSSESSNARIADLRSKTDGFVHKPFNPETVREMVRDITGVGYAHESETGAGDSPDGVPRF